jgi:hypothetical protein
VKWYKPPEKCFSVTNSGVIKAMHLRNKFDNYFIASIRIFLSKHVGVAQIEKQEFLKGTVFGIKVSTYCCWEEN